MPIYDFSCVGCGAVSEHYIPRYESEDPRCEVCGSTTKRLLARFRIAWAGDLSRFNDTGKEYAHEPGHTVYRVKSTRNADGSPQAEYITTPQQQARYCREEGLVNPKELPSNARIGADGKSWDWRGMPGQEV
jgi:putative FmdB family regulatory protein